MRFSRLAALGGVSLVALAGASAPAAAAPNGTASPTTNLTDGSVIHVTWNRPAGLTYGAVYVTQCFKSDADPTFDGYADCYIDVGTTIFLNGAGVGETDFTELFMGDDPRGFGDQCDLDSDCFIRLSPGQEDNPTADEFFPLSFAETPPVDVPEVPYNVLLPLTAAAAVGGAGFYASRRRRAA